LVLIFKTFQIL